MWSRRAILAALPAAFGCNALFSDLRALTSTGPKRVAVVFPSGLEPCAQAVDGLVLRLSTSNVAVDLLDVNKSSFATDAAQEMPRMPAAIVAVGSDAVNAVLARDSNIRIISSMTLEADRPAAASPHGRVTAAVYLDIPIHVLLTELRRLFPEKTRVGVIRNPGRGGAAALQFHGQSPESGSPLIADCAMADDLLPVFLAFRKKVDFVVCLPDGSLYNGATARPLIMASIENRLPIVGFSPAFLRAGAAVAIYPDYRGIGNQTAELVRRCLDPGDCGSWETPRKVEVAVNAKVLRMLGIEYKANANPELVIVR